MNEGTFYFSDTHLGAGSENFDLVRRSFDALEKFYWEHYMQITKVVDLGDTVECWLPDKKHENPYLDHEVIVAARNMYENIFNGQKIDIVACAGNHQTHILGNKPIPEMSMIHSVEAANNFRDFLTKVFAGDSKADFEIFRGVKDIEDGVIAHHGDFLNAGNLDEVINTFDESMSIQEKMDVINESADMCVAMQKFWQKLRKFLWPCIQKWPERLPFSFVDASFPPLIFVRKIKSLIREAIHFTERPLVERWKNPIYDETLAQFELLRELSENPEGSAIVSGHFHAPGIVNDAKGFRGTVVSLGSWHDTNANPVVGIRTDMNRKKEFILAEFNPTLDKWYARDEKTIRNLT